MRLRTEFIQLPLSFDATRLAAEVAQFDERLWRPHPEGHPGNAALPLIAVDGDPANDSVKGTMQPTAHLRACPYLRQVLASFSAPLGRTRLMRLDGNAEATRHSDTNYYWMRRMRIHVPIVTDPAVMFHCGGASVHMAAGESWIFDTWKIHNVVNPNPTRRIHLVADTAGSTQFSSLIRGDVEPRMVAFDEHTEPRIEIEPNAYPVVMSPDEQTTLVALLDVRDRALGAAVERFLDEWRTLWHAHGERRSGWTHYRASLDRFDSMLSRFTNVTLDNGVDAVELVRQALVRPALNPYLAPRETPEFLVRRRIERPVFIVSSPRSGSSLLFETMAQSPTVFTPGGESHVIIEGIDALHPAQHGWDSNRLTAADATPIIASVLETRFLAELRARDGSRRLPTAVRMLEKTPKNSLRVPFLRAIHPDAFFIYLYRDPRATISSMLDAWASRRFVTYPDLPEWDGPPWSLVLIPGWREQRGRPLEEIVAHQWSEATRILLDDLEALPPDSWSVASYDALVAEPQKEIERLCAFVGIGWDHQLTAPLPLSRHTLTEPMPDKWRRHGEQIDRIFDRVQPIADRAHEWFARPPAQRVRVTNELAPPFSTAENAPAFRSVHTSSFTDVLRSVRASLLLSTYQSGRVVVVRRDGDATNTHFVAFDSPMGIAASGNRLAIATAGAVWDYRSSPAVAERIEPRGRHDAAFVPRNTHVTGEIAVHEIAFDAGGALWIVNTRFSTLCTLDVDHSFVPRWRPPFITELAPEDRCHLNGLAMVEGRPRLVTALGETNVQGGWRADKTAGGVLIDVDSGMTIVRGLSMPHSPRWYAGKLWLLESGKGSLLYVDTKEGRVETVALLPGFTRGLAFAGHYAFIGLSQVRESVFDGIPLSRRLHLDERACGVWVVDIRNGTIVAFLKFEDAVQEIFDVQVLNDVEFPELLDTQSDLVRTHFEVPAPRV
ncbi:MAG TPA: TIGR03032 family protein [Thermoanaerobaculia bacterium]|nr:TIGR03032 family protein [Thermoanaerobaculia bacterium]